MSRHHPAGTALLVALMLFTLSMGWFALASCYHCNDPDCSNLPPMPDPWTETVAKKDASSDAR